MEATASDHGKQTFMMKRFHRSIGSCEILQEYFKVTDDLVRHSTRRTLKTHSTLLQKVDRDHETPLGISPYLALQGFPLLHLSMQGDPLDLRQLLPGRYLLCFRFQSHLPVVLHL